MAKIKAFRGFRPEEQLAAQVACRPYDVMNRQEAKQEAHNNPHSFLHVIRAEIDLPDTVDDHDERVYEQARENFQQLLKKKILQQDAQDCYYVYSLEMQGRTQTGLVACSSVEDYFADIIKKHEHTRPVKELDRIHHMQTTGIHAEPVFLAYRDVQEINAIIQSVVSGKTPVYDFTADDGIKHKLWVVDESQTVQQLTGLFSEKVPFTYIADGHHRAASSAKVGKKIADEYPAHTGNEEYFFFLSVLFPESELHIMDYNRTVKDLNGYTPEKFLQKVSTAFNVANSEQPVHPAQLHEFGMYLESKWYRLTAKEGSWRNDPIGILDVTILQENLLAPLLGIHDPRTDERIDFVGGIRGLSELEKRVNSGEMKVAFSLYPVSMEQLMQIADSGNVMPPKSTWFEPKLRSGLVVHSFSE